MTLFYLLLFLLSLLAVKLCMDYHTNQNGVHYLTFCILATFAILFYYFFSTVDSAYYAKQIQKCVYIAMIFIPAIFSNMIHEICKKNGYVVQEIIMFAATVIVIVLITNEYTGLFYKSYELLLVDGKFIPVKEYGIFHSVYYAYVGLSMLYIIVFSLINYGRNDVSKASIVYILAVVLILVVSLFLDNILNTGINFDAIGLLIDEYLLLLLSLRAPLYNLQDVVKEADAKTQRTGIIAFDNKRRLLGYNDTVLKYVKEFKTLKLDYHMDPKFPFKPILDGFMDKIDETGRKQFEIIQIKDTFFSLETDPMYVGGKVKGYQIICHDVTAQQKHIKEIEQDLNEKNKESNKYFSILSKQIDPQLVSKIISDDINQNQEKDVVVMFSDISGFTTISENMQPTEILNMLNDILATAEHCIVNNGGIIDKYIGDCVMSFWSEGDYNTNIAHACKAALEINEAAQKINESDKYQVKINFSQGIHAGPCVIGFIGDEHHREYTIIGDTVNTASRLQSLAGANNIFISQEVADKLGKAADATIIGKTALKGKANKVDVYRLNKLS